MIDKVSKNEHLYVTTLVKTMEELLWVQSLSTNRRNDNSSRLLFEIYFPRVIYRSVFRAPIFESQIIFGTHSRTLKPIVFSLDRYSLGESRARRPSSCYAKVCKDEGDCLRRTRVHDADNSIVALANVQLVRDPEVT